MIKNQKFRLYSPALANQKLKTLGNHSAVKQPEKERISVGSEYLARTPPKVSVGSRNQVKNLPGIKQPNQSLGGNRIMIDSGAREELAKDRKEFGTPLKSMSTGKKSQVGALGIDKHENNVFGLYPKEVAKPPPTQPTTITIKPCETISAIGYQTIAGRSAGKMKTNQDSFFINTNMKEDSGIALCAVYDGHGLHGHRVSGFLVNNLKGKL